MGRGGVRGSPPWDFFMTPPWVSFWPPPSKAVLWPPSNSLTKANFYVVTLLGSIKAKKKFSGLQLKIFSLVYFSVGDKFYSSKTFLGYKVKKIFGPSAQNGSFWALFWPPPPEIFFLNPPLPPPWRIFYDPQGKIVFMTPALEFFTRPPMMWKFTFLNAMCCELW